MTKPISYPPQKRFGDFRIYKISIWENYLYKILKFCQHIQDKKKFLPSYLIKKVMENKGCYKIYVKLGCWIMWYVLLIWKIKLTLVMFISLIQMCLVILDLNGFLFLFFEVFVGDCSQLVK
jgi:hypothetical protein